MFTSKKIKTVALTIALFGGMALFAQVPQQMSKDAQQTEVKDAELQKFAKVFKKVQNKNQEAQEEIKGAIKDEGLTVERYQKLRTAGANPNSKVDASEAEMKKKQHVDAKIQKMQPKLQKEQTAIIENSSLTMARWQEISNALRSDAKLQKKFQGLLMKDQK